MKGSIKIVSLAAVLGAAASGYSETRINLATGLDSCCGGYGTYAQAAAEGYSDVTSTLYGPGTGADISDTLWSAVNNSFYVEGSGPGTVSGSYGGGLINGGTDAGSGVSWALEGASVIDLGGSESTSSGDTVAAANVVNTSRSNIKTNFTTEDTHNVLVYKITNTSMYETENFTVGVAGSVVAEVSLGDSQNEYGLDEALLNFGFSAENGDFTGNVTESTAYAFTGMSYGAGTYEYVSNTTNPFYSGTLNPGASIYFAVQTENYSAAYAQTPGPAAVAPFALGLFGALRRRSKKTYRLPAH